MTKEYKHSLYFKTFYRTELPYSIDQLLSTYERIRGDVEEKTGHSIPRIEWTRTDEIDPWVKMFAQYLNTVQRQDQFEYKFYRFWLDRAVEWKAAMLWNEIRNFYLKLGDKNGGGEKKGTALADQAYAEYMDTYK